MLRFLRSLQGKHLGIPLTIRCFHKSYLPRCLRVKGLRPLSHHHFINHYYGLIPEYVSQVLVDGNINCLQEAKESDHQNHYGNKKFNQRKTVSLLSITIAPCGIPLTGVDSYVIYFQTVNSW